MTNLSSGGVNGHIAQAIIETGARSWAETDLKGVLSSKPVEFKKAGRVPYVCDHHEEMKGLIIVKEKK